jgi:hypothetical protein
MNNKGFSAVAAMLVVVVLVSVGAVGWYVSGQQGNKKNASISKLPQKTTAANSQNNIPAGWSKYENKALGLTYYYPKDWEEAGAPDVQPAEGYNAVIPISGQELKYLAATKTWQSNNDNNLQPEVVLKDNNKTVWNIAGGEGSDDVNCKISRLYFMVKDKMVNVKVPSACES